ncbi:MAG: SDR family oxidoreductase [Chloroflexi bacterium]|nr:SDR family oxidoreductase [Chloroflexota bacterium]
MKSSECRTALITGATSGIGEAYAKRLARDGFSLILHGRRQEKLNTLAQELEKAHNISTEVIIAELSQKKGLKKVESRIQELDRLDVLINNAGYWLPGNFWERDPDSIEAMIQVHVTAPARFTRAALPRMIQQNKGDIINVSSMGVYVGIPTVENYNATKAYLLNFTETLHAALLGTGVRVQVLVPGMTMTEFHSRLGADPQQFGSISMLPEEVVEISLRCLDKGKVLCIPGLKNKLTVKLVNSLPRRMYYKVMHSWGERSRKSWEEIEKKLEGQEGHA